jgi:hypothetical protein
VEAIFDKIRMPFDALDAATDAALRRAAPGWVEFAREPLTFGSVVYHLWQRELGDIGQMRLRKITETLSEIWVLEPERHEMQLPTRDEIYQTYSLSEADRQARRIEYLRAEQRQAAELHSKRVAHQEKVIEGYLTYLNVDLALIPGEPDVTGEKEVPEIVEAASEAQPAENSDDFVPPPTEQGRKYLKQYNAKTAKQIGDAIPNAWERFNGADGGGQWGPGYIAKEAFYAPETVGRYLRAFRAMGITRIHGIDLPP